MAIMKNQSGLSESLPDELREIQNPQTALPEIAKNPRLMGMIEDAVYTIPTSHHFYLEDSRNMELEPESVDLIVTSPPYWSLKQYNDIDGQMGHISDYEEFLQELSGIWKKCYEVLIPGGRLVCVVGDVCLSRRKNNGRHTVVPLHASIQEDCRLIGFDNLAPIIWHKIANAVYESKGNGAGFLGKPYEPNSVIKNDIEYILMQRKPGGYRKPSLETRVLSLISDVKYQEWFQQVWTGVTGASTRNHPAPYPIELAQRLIRMFSFVGDTVLDPFLGTGSTSIAAMQSGRNSIGYEIDRNYLEMAGKRLKSSMNLLTTATLEIHDKN